MGLQLHSNDQHKQFPNLRYYRKLNLIIPIEATLLMDKMVLKVLTDSQILLFPGKPQHFYPFQCPAQTFNPF